MMSDQDLQQLACSEGMCQEKEDQGCELQKQERGDQSLLDQIEGFIHTQVVDRGLDERTAKAYQIDLEHFYLWLKAETGKQRFERKPGEKAVSKTDQTSSQMFNVYSSSRPAMVPVPPMELGKDGYEERMEMYLKYLAEEKRLRFSTISRKQRVFHSYLSYLMKQGVVEGYRPLRVSGQQEGKKDSDAVYMSKQDIDLFFQEIQKEYDRLDSDFRRRVCLRDQVMMGLLFYHRIEVSELLRMEVSDYDRKTMVLTVRRKRENNRQVYLFSRALQKQMAKWLDEHDHFEHERAYHNRMFLSKMGKPLSMKMVINIFDKYRVKAGIEKGCTPKDLKNSLGRYAEEVVREMGGLRDDR